MDSGLKFHFFQVLARYFLFSTVSLDFRKNSWTKKRNKWGCLAEDGAESRLGWS